MTGAATTGALTQDVAFAVVRDAVALVCEVDPATVSPQTGLTADLEADSLALVEIAEVVEAALREAGTPVVFADEDLDAFGTLADVCAYLVARSSVPGRALAGV